MPQLERNRTEDYLLDVEPFYIRGEASVSGSFCKLADGRFSSLVASPEQMENAEDYSVLHDAAQNTGRPKGRHGVIGLRSAAV
jgi:hypothetical protein